MIAFMHVFWVHFCKIFVRWRDKTALISEGIDDSNRRASKSGCSNKKSCWGPKIVEAMRVRAVMKNRLLWKSGIYIIVCQFERCDPFNNQRSGKMLMSIGITILTGSDAPMKTAQVKHLLTCGMRGVHWKRRVFLTFTYAMIIDLKFQDETQC